MKKRTTTFEEKESICKEIVERISGDVRIYLKYNARYYNDGENFVIEVSPKFNLCHRIGEQAIQVLQEEVTFYEHIYEFLFESLCVCVNGQTIAVQLKLQS